MATPVATLLLDKGLTAGSRIKYYDGERWITGILYSLEPAVLQLSDGSEISTNMTVVLDGLREGVLEKQ